jgi:hypothetical protein
MQLEEERDRDKIPGAEIAKGSGKEAPLELLAVLEASGLVILTECQSKLSQK